MGWGEGAILERSILADGERPGDRLWRGERVIDGFTEEGY
jgi:hypothetical protein